MDTSVPCRRYLLSTGGILCLYTSSSLYVVSPTADTYTDTFTSTSSSAYTLLPADWGPIGRAAVQLLCTERDDVVLYVRAFLVFRIFRI